MTGRKIKWFWLLIIVTMSVTGSEGLAQSNNAKKESLLGLLAKSPRADSNRVIVLLDLVKFYLYSNNDTAMILSREATELSQKIKYSPGVLRGMNAIAICYWQQNNMDLAISYFHKAIALATTERNYDLLALVYTNLASYYNVLGQTDSSLKYHLQSMKAAKLSKSDQRYSKALIELGMVYYTQSKYFESLKCLLEAKDIPETNKNGNTLINIYIQLGMIYTKLKNIEKSFEAFHIAQRINDTVNNERFSIVILENLGVAYAELKKDSDSAKIFYQQVLELAEKNHDEEAILLSSANLGVISSENKDYNLALDYFNRAEKSPLIPLRNRQSSLLYVSIGQTYQALGNRKLAEEYTMKGLELARKHNFRETEKNACKLLGDLEAHKGDYKKAWEFYSRYAALLDSTVNQDIKDRVNTAVYENMLKEKQNETMMLEKDVQIHEKTIHVQGLYLIIIGSLSVMGIVLLFLALRHNRKQFSLNLDLIRKNQELEESKRLLFESEEKYRLIADNTSDGMLRLSSDNKVLYASPSYKSLFGYTSDEEMPSSVDNFLEKIHSDDRVTYVELIRNSIATKREHLSISYRFKHKTEGYTWIEDNAHLTYDDNGNYTGSYIICRDINDRMLSTIALSAALEKSETANQLKSSLLLNMSHELRTPLNGILGFADMLTRDLREPNQIEMVGFIRVSAKRLNRTLNSIMELAQLESQSISVHVEPVDLGTLTIQVIKSISDFYEDSECQLITSVDDAVYTMADKRLIQKVAYEVIDNAFKYTLKGTVEVTLSKVVNEKNQPLAVLKVKDSGSGISEEKMAYIFDAFRQGSEGMGRSHEGTGLGLTLVQKYTTLLGGTVDVTSKPGLGSIFTLSFPLSEVPPLEKSGKPLKPASSTLQRPRTKPKVLVVEDNKVNCILINNYLNGKFDTTIAVNGREAVEKAAAGNFDLVLMDINLGPGIDGMKATKEIRKNERYSSTPFIAVTGFSSEMEKRIILESGLDDILVKPYEESNLLGMIRKHLKID